MIRFRWMAVLVAALALLPDAVEAQERGTVTGVVTAQETQQPLQGAQVRIAGTTLGTITNQQGRFVITNVPAGARTVQVTFIGYRSATQEVAVTAGGSASVNLTLATDVLGLDEIVVIGYGEARRRDVAGAVASLRVEQIESIPTPSIDNALQGRLAGVQVTQNSGAPGSAISVRVRGSSSISAGNQPLYVIDGVPLTQGSFNRNAGTFGGQQVDALSDLNPGDIESIEVLKDASAAAIYGSRASNGVVLITTKRGLAGRPEMNFNMYAGQQTRWRSLDMLNTDQYILIKNEGIFNGFGIEDYYGYEDDGVDNFVEVPRGTNTNWLDEVMRTAPISNIDASVRGGTEQVRYFVGGSSFNQQGIVRGFGYDRLAGRVNLDYQPYERITLGTNISLAQSVVERSRGDNTIYGPFANAIANPPIDPVYNDDGTYFRTPYANPVGLALENEGEERSLRVLGNTFAAYRLSPALTARGSVGVDQYNLRSRIYDSPLVGLATGTGGAGTSNAAFVTKATYEATLNFDRMLADRHAFSGVVGASYEDNQENYSSVSGNAFPSESFRYLTSAANITAGTDSLSTWALQSYFGRASWTFADRVTTTFNVRADGSSRFGENNRYGVFPSASVLWHLGDEAFMQNQQFFNALSLRMSYGRTGNQQAIGDFASRGLFAGGFNYGDQPGIAPSQMANPDLRWETTDQFNVGTDFAVINNRLSMGIDYYIKKTNDLLVARPIPRSTGFASIWSNVGSMENRGIELTTRARWLDGPVRWTTDFNIARNRNEVTALLNNEPINTNLSGISRVEVGQPIGAFYGYRTDGIFRSQAEIDAHARQSSATSPGDIRFVDVNGDGVINADDRTIIGSPWPDFEGGLTNQLAFGRFDVNVFAQFSYGNDIFNAIRFYSDDFGSYDDNHTTRALDRWTPENPNATEPRAVYGDPAGNTRASDRFLEDGSYLRLKNVVLGYTLPTTFTDRLGMRQTRFYLQGQNLATWTKYTGFDPEVNFAGNTSITRGTDFYTLPQARTITAGVNVSF
jgi:TonB-dependent starch-binding outer membrane protein SusC